MQIVCRDWYEHTLNLTQLHSNSSPNDKSSYDSCRHNPTVVTLGWSTTLFSSWSARDGLLHNNGSVGVAKSNGFYLCWSSLDRFVCTCVRLCLHSSILTPGPTTQNCIEDKIMKIIHGHHWQQTTTWKVIKLAFYKVNISVPWQYGLQPKCV